jgi:hypothetical protein
VSISAPQRVSPEYFAALDDLSRRDFLSRTARTCFGLTIGGSMARLFDSTAFAADPAVLKAGGGKAKHVIYLYMSGGMTHIDTFDPKPDAPADVRGPVTAIKTKADGIQLGHCLPQLAQHADKIALSAAKLNHCRHAIALANITKHVDSFSELMAQA